MTESVRNDASFATELEALRPLLMKHVFWLCRDRGVAEGAVQEAMLRAWRSRDKLRDRAALKRWLIVICRRELARTYERKQLPTICLDELPPEAEPAAEDGDAAEMAEVRKAILELADMYRLPLLMQVVEGLPTADIAARLGIPRQTVLTQLFRARRLLRDRLSPRASGPARLKRPVCGPLAKGNRASPR